MSDLLSIIVPVYNARPYLKHCIESLLAQTYPSIEILLIDDGSLDGSSEICKTYAEKDERIRFLQHAHQGVCHARNKALDIMKGNYIAFVDADDWIEETMFQKLMTLAKEHDADVVICDWANHHGNDAQHYEIHHEAIDNHIAAEALRDAYLLNRYDCYLWNKLYRKEFWGTLRFPDEMVLQDQYIHAELFLYCRKFYYTAEPLYHYRHHASVANQAIRMKRKYSMFRSWREHERVSQLCNSMALEENRYYAQKCAIDVAILDTHTHYLTPEQRDDLYNYLATSRQQRSVLPIKEQLYWWSLEHSTSLCKLFARLSLVADKHRRAIK